MKMEKKNDDGELLRDMYIASVLLLLRLVFFFFFFEDLMCFLTIYHAPPCRVHGPGASGVVVGTTEEEEEEEA
jgi:hypothetical protein